VQPEVEELLIGRIGGDERRRGERRRDDADGEDVGHLNAG
jgi:hypothetical protein